jgi:hypothetical protein
MQQGGALLEDARDWAEELRQSVDPEHNQNAVSAFGSGPLWSGEKQFSREENFAAAGGRLEAQGSRMRYLWLSMMQELAAASPHRLREERPFPNRSALLLIRASNT